MGIARITCVFVIYHTYIYFNYTYKSMISEIFRIESTQLGQTANHGANRQVLDSESTYENKIITHQFFTSEATGRYLRWVFNFMTTFGTEIKSQSLRV